MINQETADMGSVDRWLAGLAGRKVAEPVVADDLCKRVRVFADLSPHLPAGAAGAWLLFRHAGKIETVAMNRPHIIGRGSDASIKLGYPWMSRRHFAITPRDGDFDVEYLGSKNPLTVNGLEVARTRLESGDVICIGSQQFLFVFIR